MCDCAGAGVQIREWPTCGGMTPGKLIRRVQALETFTQQISDTNKRQAHAIKVLQGQMETCCNGGGGDAEVTVWSADWNGTGYDVPASPPQDTIVLRIFTGPEPYDGPEWPGVRDLYITTADDA